MPKKNLALFVLFSALVIGGWWRVEFHYREQPKPPDTQAKKDEGKKDAKAAEPPKDKEPPPKDKEPAPKPQLPAEQVEQFQLAMRFGFAFKEEPAELLTLGDKKNPHYY